MNIVISESDLSVEVISKLLIGNGFRVTDTHYWSKNNFFVDAIKDKYAFRVVVIKYEYGRYAAANMSINLKDIYDDGIKDTLRVLINRLNLDDSSQFVRVSVEFDDSISVPSNEAYITTQAKINASGIMVFNHFLFQMKEALRIHEQIIDSLKEKEVSFLLYSA
ncbi:hypothetical protein [Spongorhabdus nitratireducens]